MTHLFRSRMAIAVTLTAMAACSKAAVESTETAEPVAVQVGEAARGSIASTITVPGVVAAAPGADWTIVAPEAGRIAELPRVEGDTVHAGDLLVRFEVPSVTGEVAARKAEAAQAAARLDMATAASTRVAGLFQRGIASQKEVDEAKRELREAEAAVAQAKTAGEAAAQLEARLTVRARFDGVIARRHHNAGDVVEASAGDPVLRIVDPARIEVLAAVPVAELTRLAVGRTARVLAPGADGLAGAVIARPPVIDPGAASGDVRVSLPRGTTAARLPVGTPVNVEIIAEHHPDALLVPSGAIGHEGDEAFVMVAGADHKAHRKAVKVGLVTRVATEILEGLSAGDAVILLGTEPVPDGAAIEIEK